MIVYLSSTNTAESGAHPQDTNGEGRGNQGPTVVWIQYLDPSPGILCSKLKTECESSERSMRPRKRLWAGTLIQMSGGSLAKRFFLSFSEILRVQCVEDRGGRRKSESIAHEQYKRLGS